MAGEPPTSPPGAARAYTDTGFLLAGLIIEALTGRPLQQAYRELVLDPAGMTERALTHGQLVSGDASRTPVTRP